MWYKQNLRNLFEFNVKWGGAKVPPLLCLKFWCGPTEVRSVLVFVEEEILLGGIVGPDVFDRVERFAIVLQLL